MLKSVQIVKRHIDHFRVCLQNYLPRKRSLLQKYFKTPDLKSVFFFLFTVKRTDIMILFLICRI